MDETPEILAKDIRYFNSIRGYTLALINAFNGVELYINQEDSELDKVYTVPISFGNYEKSIILEDISENEITTGNINFLPRLILSFEALTKAPERQTNKYRKLSKRVFHPEYKKEMLNVAYNSVAYDFQFSLLLQTRGVTQAFQLTEEILVYFKPTMNLNILECPIFNEKTETQIQIADPAFEINTEFSDVDVNIINVTFDLTVRGNIYSPIEMIAPIDTLKLFLHVWDTEDYKDSKLSSYYNLQQDEEDSRYLNIKKRTFNGTIPYDPVVEASEQTVIEKRPDYKPPEEDIKTAIDE